MNEGERLAHEWFTKRGVRHLQADWIILGADCVHLYEVKYQERFEPPPFAGHGLPQWQVAARLELQERTGMRAVLLVFDKATGETFWQYLDELENGERFDTNGEKPRRVYPLTNFRRAPDWREATTSATPLNGEVAPVDAIATEEGIP